MARTVGLITELEVVNSVLSVAGDNPVQSLDDTYQPVFIIKQMLLNISRTMQSKGYWFNNEYGVTLTPSTINSKIILPFNIIRFDPVDNRFVARGLNVYDRTDRTNIITDDIVADITLQLEFEELPQVAREYIRTACRIQYNNEYFGETNFKQEWLSEFNEAKLALDKADIENESISMFSSSKVNNIAFKNRRRG